MPPDLGVLVHCFDEREEEAQPWRPQRPQPGEAYRANHLKMSGSLIYQDQQASNTQIPLFKQGGGVVLRQSATRVFCGFGTDAGGLGDCQPTSDSCIPGCWKAGFSWSVWCNPEETHLSGNQEGSCYNRPYRPQDMGILFERSANNNHYNEVIIDSLFWHNHLPDAIEAFYYTVGSDAAVIAQTRRWHQQFITQYPTSDCAMLKLNVNDWVTPFRADF